jgi:uncharacterized membrane protein
VTIYSWLHWLSLALYVGATALLLLVVLPALWRERDDSRRLRRAAAFMRIYDPLSIGALGVLIMTGAFRLTVYKEALRGAFFAQMGRQLAWKLFFAFLVINVAAYVAFGIGHRLVGHAEVAEEVDPAWVRSMLRRLAVATALVLALTALTVWLAFSMPPGAVPSPG